MTDYYKATRKDGTSFSDGGNGRVDYALALSSGLRVTPRERVPSDSRVLCQAGVLHAATVETETLVGGSWPCRLFRVQGRPLPLDYEGHPHKRGFASLRVVEELPAWRALGPQGQQVAALISRCETLTLTASEVDSLAAAWAAAWAAARDAARAAARDATWDAARAAARAAARDATWDAARAAARDAARDATRAAARDAARAATRAATWAAARAAAWALVVRDLIGDQFTQAHYDLLTGPWRQVIGPAHPDDAQVRLEVSRENVKKVR